MDDSQNQTKPDEVDLPTQPNAHRSLDDGGQYINKDQADEQQGRLMIQCRSPENKKAGEQQMLPYKVLPCIFNGIKSGLWFVCI